jgi:hypothetical protein
VPSFGSRLLEELSEWLPEEVLASLRAAPDTVALSFADRGVRGLFPLGLEASGVGAAARAVRELPSLSDGESVRQCMFALERIARAYAAPELLVRAAHGVCACALSLTLTESRGAAALERAEAQLVSALVRLVTMSVKAKVAADLAVQCLA